MYIMSMRLSIYFISYLLFFAMSVVGLFCGMGNSGKVPLKTKFFHINMIFCILMPFILLLKYAYSVDYQAQGRYLMPAVIPIMYYVCMGFERLPVYRKGSERRKTVLTAGVLVFLMAALLIMVFCNALPIYLMTPVL